MLSTKRHGWSFFGGLFCSTRHCKALAYATIFSLGISQMSQQAKADMTGGMNLHQWRHGGAGGAGSSSCMCFWSLNEALTCQANFSMSSSRTVDSSAHPARDITPFSLPSHPFVGLGYGWLWQHFFILLLSRSGRSLQEGGYFGLELWWFPQVLVSAFRPHSARGHIRVSRSASCRLLQKLASHHLFLLLSSDPQLSLHLHSGPEWAFFLYNLSISSSRVAAVDKAFRCASCTLAKLLSIESSHSHRDGLFQGKWKHSVADRFLDVGSAILLWWMMREDGRYLLQNGWFSWWRTGQPV